jgi:hypothetical protein
MLAMFGQIIVDVAQQIGGLLLPSTCDTARTNASRQDKALDYRTLARRLFSKNPSSRSQTISSSSDHLGQQRRGFVDRILAAGSRNHKHQPFV